MASEEERLNKHVVMREGYEIKVEKSSDAPTKTRSYNLVKVTETVSAPSQRDKELREQALKIEAVGTTYESEDATKICPEMGSAKTAEAEHDRLKQGIYDNAERENFAKASDLEKKRQNKPEDADAVNQRQLEMRKKKNGGAKIATRAKIESKK